MWLAALYERFDAMSMSVGVDRPTDRVGCSPGRIRVRGDFGMSKKAARIFALLCLVVAGTAEAQRVTSNFGVRKDPFNGAMKMHAGMDMAGVAGMPVYATGDGFVKRARWAGGYGNLVEIEHGFGYETRFGHLSRVLVGEGQFVRRGQMVGLMGSTGRSTAPHLHYEVRISGRPVQPAGYMQIVFARQPDWNVVRASLSSPVTPSYPVRTATIALAHVETRGRVSGDIDLDLGGAGTKSQASQSGFSVGHVSYSR